MSDTPKLSSDLTWHDLVALGKSCPKLRTLVFSLRVADDAKNSLGGSGASKCNEGVVDLPGFQHLERLEFFYLQNWSKNSGPISLDFTRFPSLQELLVTDAGLVYLGLIDVPTPENNNNKLWSANLMARTVAPIRRLTIRWLGKLKDQSSLGLARSLARRYHPRCIIDMWVKPKGADSMQDAQWFRDLMNLRDDLLKDDVLRMDVGWKRLSPVSAEEEAATAKADRENMSLAEIIGMM